MTIRLTAVVVVSTLALLGAACGTKPERPTANQTANPFPTRPRTIDLATADPCAALDAAQRSDLGIVAANRDDLQPGLPGCLYVTSDGSYRVQFLGSTGARALLPGYPQQQGTDIFTDARETEIDGFGAVEARLVRGAPADCSLTVDTGDDSSIQYYYSTLDNHATSPADLQAGCEKARAFAHLGLQSLAAQ